MKRSFAKPATTHAQQVSLLQQRGMVIDNPVAAEFYLQHLNYYRLGAYWLPFEADHATHTFRPGTHFSQVLNLYVFDRELRLLVLDAIERIEVSVRSQWAYQLAHQHGPHAHLDVTLAFKRHLWKTNLDKLSDEVARSDEAFIKHLQDIYSESLPPVWAVCEVMSLGLLSRWYNNLKPMPTRRAIAAVYSVDEQVLESWLRHLSLVRNTCAHHSRLWNREFTITPLLPRNKPAGLAAQFHTDSRKLYNALVILLHCMDVIAPQHHWRTRLKDLIVRYDVSVAAMDFPVNWQDLRIWQDAAPCKSVDLKPREMLVRPVDQAATAKLMERSSSSKICLRGLKKASDPDSLLRHASDVELRLAPLNWLVSERRLSHSSRRLASPQVKSSRIWVSGSWNWQRHCPPLHASLNARLSMALQKIP